MTPELLIAGDPAGAAAERLAEASGDVVLTGGSTPRAAYERVAGARPDWSGVRIWFSDERCVPPDHEHSNYAMVKAVLLDGIEGGDVHRIEGELGPAEAADRYEGQLREARPDFGLMLLGIGPDAHICSLFPGDAALGERERMAVGVETPGMAPLVSRVTLTLPVVNSAREVVFLVTGEDKADALARAFSGAPDPSAPASLVEAPATLIADEAAAARLR